LRLCRSRSLGYPTRPQNKVAQIYATATAICREISYPQLHLEGPLSWLSPPPLGRVLVLFCYWAVITYMMTDGAIIWDTEYYERIGFRAAWISVTQVPLVYLLASKSSIIIHLIGSSHERLNWLHRWVSRTLLVTVTVHGGFFMREWMRADFVKLELAMMPMVKYGIGAWAVLVWTFLSSLSPIRRLAYEVFVLQHLAMAGVFLWLLWVHVPDYARYNVWFAIGAISLDWIIRGALLVYRNILVRRTCSGMQRIGYCAELRTRGKDISTVTIRGVPLGWRPGQHLYLWIPRLGLLETHPFTIASPYLAHSKCPCDEIQLAVRAQSGFSRRLYEYAGKMQKEDKAPRLTAFVAGPYGAPPDWSAYETLILISASTGASFTLPILESVLHGSNSVCVQRISFLLIARQRAHIEFYTQRLLDAIAHAESIGIDLTVEIAITENRLSPQSSLMSESQLTDSGLSVSEQECPCNGDTIFEEPKTDKTYPLVRSSPAHSPSNSISEQKTCDDIIDTANTTIITTTTTTTTNHQKPFCDIVYTAKRPICAEFIRAPVEATGGETAVAVCGG
ncbi:hypothetical protein GP486_008172, partial [Trichoglossum hirsutum]